MNSVPTKAKSEQNSPITPTQSTTELSFMTTESQYNAEVNRVLKKIGYETGYKIADTLQGTIWRISKTSSKTGQTETSILKVTNQFLQQQSTATFNGQTYNVKENIISEQQILKHLTEQNDCSESIVKFTRFFKTNTDLYLLQEDGGDCLFDFVKKAHKLIRNGNLDAAHWKTVCRIIFKQMVESVSYIHSKNVCHFDISLENFLINDVSCAVKRYSKTKWKLQFVTDTIDIKLCDFGLAKRFTNLNNFSSNKWCGKQNYKSPEIVSKKEGFDAIKNDIWGLGMCLFLLCVGSTPWNAAHKTDEIFMYVMNHSIADLLTKWNCLDFVDQHLVIIMDFALKYEEDRIDLINLKHVVDQLKTNFY